MSLSNKWPILAHWRILLVVSLPVLLLPIIFLDDDEDEVEGGEPAKKTTKFKCAYVILLMAIYWVVEVVPLAMTSFLPIVLLPLLGIQPTKQVSMNYMRETNMMFIGGLIISAAVEYSDLHRRIALRVLTLVGSSPAKLVLGVMLTTMFLSMWMLNSAATAMMVPIVLAVLEELQKTPKTIKNLETVSMTVRDNDEKMNGHSENQLVYQIPTGNLDGSQQIDEGEVRRRKQEKNMMLLSIAYASNIGGSGVVTGTTPNLISFELLKAHNIGQNGKYMDLTFATFMAYAVIPMLVNVLLSWFYLIVTFLGWPNWLRFGKKRKQQQVAQSEENNEESIMETAKEKEKRVQKMLVREYKSLGQMNFHQAAVTGLFIIVVLLWFFRDPRFVRGWGDLLPEVAIGDSTAAMFIAFLLFAFPRDPSFLRCRKPKISGALLDWKYVQMKMPWDISLLMGSGFAISDAAEESGLSEWIGEKLEGLSSLEGAGILIIVMAMTAGITEILSNAAAGNLVIPILISLSIRLKLHPLYLTLPACIACSFAFMLPVAAPSNGIVFAAAQGDMKIIDMVKSGAFLNVLCTVVMFLIHISYGNLLFDFNNYEYPDAPEINSTLTNF